MTFDTKTQTEWSTIEHW